MARPQQTTKVTDALADDQLTRLIRTCNGATVFGPPRRGCGRADGRDRCARRRTARHDCRRSGPGPWRRGGPQGQGRQAAAGAVRAADRRRAGPLPTYSAQIRIEHRRAVGRRAGPPAPLPRAECRDQGTRKSRRCQQLSPASLAAHLRHQMAGRRR